MKNIIQEKKEKTKTRENIKENKILNSNIDNKIQNLRNNTMKKIKLYKKSQNKELNK